MRRLFGVSVVVVIAAVLVWAGWLGARWLAGDETAHNPSDVTATALARRMTLEERVVTRGVVGFLPTGQLRLGTSGRVTRVFLERGDIIQDGTAIAAIDGRVVVAVADAEPFWRDLSPGVRGPDVRALQAILSNAGLFDSELDGNFGASTEAAWRSWQKNHGFADNDGAFRMGDLATGAWPARTGNLRFEPGEFVSVDDAFAELTSVAPGVTLELIPSARLRVAEGDAAMVEVSATGAVASGVLTRIFDDPTEMPDGSLEFLAQVTLSEELKAPEGSQTRVFIVTATAENVVAVPLASVISDGEGNPAVRVISNDGRMTLVGVELGMSDGGWVEVLSGISEGGTVVVATSQVD